MSINRSLPLPLLGEKYSAHDTCVCACASQEHTRQVAYGKDRDVLTGSLTHLPSPCLDNREKRGGQRVGANCSLLSHGESCTARAGVGVG